MDEQMSMFGEGGLLDEGGQVDEESGNDVPIGGTKEGVRDDIPAMLSEGEFVFPEDVTRYHGLEKLMTLRQEAKMGLKKMEAMGQMGNSEDATIPDDLPFNMDDLLVVVTGEEEAEGKKDDGPIKAQAGTFVPATSTTTIKYGCMGFQESMYAQQQDYQNPTCYSYCHHRTCKLSSSYSTSTQVKQGTVLQQFLRTSTATRLCTRCK